MTTSTELAIRHGGVSPALARASLNERMEYAKALAQAGLLPPAYRANPANVLLAIEQGEALGIHHLAAINGIHIIDGKPSLGAELMRALILRDGHRFDVVEMTPERATVKVARRERPGDVQTFTWTIEDAQRAGLVSKGTWQKYPAAQLLARASSAAGRAVFPDVLSGMGYTPEELGAEVDGDGRIVDVTATASVREGQPPEVRADARNRRMYALFNEIGLGGKDDRDARLDLSAEIVGRPLASSADLTGEEIETLIAELRRRAAVMPQQPETVPA